MGSVHDVGGTIGLGVSARGLVGGGLGFLRLVPIYSLGQEC